MLRDKFFLRPIAMKLVVDRFDADCESNPAVLVGTKKEFPAVLAMFKAFRKHGSLHGERKRVDITRGVAEMFSSNWLEYFRTHHPEYLYQFADGDEAADDCVGLVDPELADPPNAMFALAEICIDIERTLKAARGRKHSGLDPIGAHVTNERYKSARTRYSRAVSSATGYGGDEYSVEHVAGIAGVAKSTAAKSIAEGKDAAATIAAAVKAMGVPPDEILALVDYDAKIVVAQPIKP
jgi:hypothetical protein